MRVVWRVLINAYRLLTWPLWAAVRLFRKRGTWVELTLHGSIEDAPSPPAPGLLGLLSRLRPRSLSVSEVRTLTRRAAADPLVEGVLVSLSSLRAGWATLHAMRDALRPLVEEGKRLVVMLPEGASQRELIVASAGSTVTAPGSVGFSVLGPAAQRTYLAPLLEHLGIRFEVIAQGRYKTAAEALVRSEMSEAEREQAGALIDTLKDELSRSLSQRVTPKSQPEQLFAEAVFGAQTATGLGVLDQCGYRDEIEASLGLGEERQALPARAYLERSKSRGLVPLRAAPKIAVLSLHGPIGDVSSSRSIALKPTAASLKMLRERDDVAGVILHLDTPGGSAVVSDLLHHEVQRLAAKKPVVAWMGNVAASGGYYLAAGAKRIVAAPSTLTGSIGVISAHLIAARLLERLGVHSQVVKMTPHADLGSLARPLREDERALLARESERFYERFLDVVAQGRSHSRERVAELAQGRVWSGRDAHANGLVDVLGGYDAALDELRALLDEGRRRVDAEAPLWVHPTRATGLLRGDSARMWLPGQLEPARDLLELATNGTRVLAYSLDAAELQS